MSDARAPGVMERAALAYLARGWSVIPVRPRAKRPLIRWLELQGRLPTPEEVRGWYRRWPDANVGIVTGAISGLVVLDVDPGHGGEESLAGLVLRYGPLPRTVEARTGGGGRHLYFDHPGEEVRNQVGVAPGIDVRGDGGYVVAPPSVHESGRRYEWRPHRRPGDLPLAPLPRWLRPGGGAAGARAGHPREYWRRLVRTGVPRGERNSTIASLAGHLLWHGVDPEVVLELLLAWNRLRCRPPLPDAEVARTVESIVRTHERRAREGGARGDAGGADPPRPDGAPPDERLR